MTTADPDTPALAPATSGTSDAPAHSEPGDRNPEEHPTAMLDVHPLNHAPHTWKEFLLHIATICVGLLIAIGLEQTVEVFHRLHERHRLQEELRAEGLHNRDGIGPARLYLDDLQAWDLKAARIVQSAIRQPNKQVALYPEAFKIEPEVRSKLRFLVPSDAVWSSAKSSGAVALLPSMQALAYTRLERFHDLVTNMDLEWRKRGAAVVAVEARFAPDPATMRPDLSTLQGPELEQLAEALMSEYAVTRTLERELQAFGDANQAVLNGIQDEDAMAAFMYRGTLGFGTATPERPTSESAPAQSRQH